MINSYSVTSIHLSSLQNGDFKNIFVDELCLAKKKERRIKWIFLWRDYLKEQKVRQTFKDAGALNYSFV